MRQIDVVQSMLVVKVEACANDSRFDVNMVMVDSLPTMSSAYHVSVFSLYDTSVTFS